MSNKITKAVIPVAGLGTRFLPATKVVPKELLPIVDKPALQYVIEEAVNSGLTDIILVTNPLKSLIEEHFTSGTAHDELLKERGKHHLLKSLHELNEKINIHTVLQDKPLGLGHAVLCAKEAVGDDWFVVLLPDMLIDSKVPCTAQMVKIWKEVEKAVIATEHAPREKISQYGIIDVLPCANREDLYKVKSLIEKPKLEEAPSDLFISGRYLLPPSVFKYLEQTKPGAGGEIQLTGALSELVDNDELYAFEFKGVLHDTGDKIGFLMANIHYALKNEGFADKLKRFLNERR